ncbi:MAG: hypothetical protein WA104_03970 [Thermodesulfovibrionales bacterium]
MVIADNKSKSLVDKSQAYFWTDEWQKGERKAEEAKKRKEFKDFKNVRDAIKWLKK